MVSSRWHGVAGMEPVQCAPCCCNRANRAVAIGARYHGHKL